jgi:SAM-dependent methyltransferase
MVDRNCPLCQKGEGKLFFENGRSYFRCSQCALVFVPPHQFLSLEAEKAVYDLHENSPDDPGYRLFLGRLFEPVSRLLTPNSSGLDFGSGPGPTLSVMFADAGHTMHLYDPFYAPDTRWLHRQYDFITASEVVEHLRQPREALDRLWSCLKPNGVLGIMTKRVIDRDAFSRWHYKNDPTHICFFSTETFVWLANYWGAELTVVGQDVVVLKKIWHSGGTAQ